MKTPPPRSRSGFVYACQNEQGWIKIGFTRRVPHKRIKSLSSTSSRETFSLVDALHAVDCLEVEKIIHNELERLGVRRQKEFFEISPAQARDILAWGGEKYFQSRPPPPLFEEEYDFQNDDDTPMGLAVLEGMSVQGSASASFRVAEHLLARKDISGACVMFGASHAQGHEAGLLYKKFLLSFNSSNELRDFHNDLVPWVKKIHSGAFVSQKIVDLLQKEQKCWRDHPDRARLWGVCWEGFTPKMPKDQGRPPSSKL